MQSQRLKADICFVYVALPRRCNFLWIWNSFPGPDPVGRLLPGKDFFLLPVYRQVKQLSHMRSFFPSVLRGAGQVPAAEADTPPFVLLQEKAADRDSVFLNPLQPEELINRRQLDESADTLGEKYSHDSPRHQSFTIRKWNFSLSRWQWIRFGCLMSKGEATSSLHHRSQNSCWRSKLFSK